MTPCLAKAQTPTIVFIVLIMCIVSNIFIFLYSDYLDGVIESHQIPEDITVEDMQRALENEVFSLADRSAAATVAVFDRLSVRIVDVEYGYERDAVLKCNYSTVDVDGILTEKALSEIIEKALSYCIDGGAIDSQTVRDEFEDDIVNMVNCHEGAVEGAVEIKMVQAEDGELKVQLNDDIIDHLTGGLVTVRDRLWSINGSGIGGNDIGPDELTVIKEGIGNIFSLNDYAEELTA